MPPLAGVYGAAVTPRGKKGEIDFGAAFELIDLLSKAGVAGIALFDSAGEYPAFHRDERCRLVYLAAKRSRVPLLAGIGSASLEDSEDLARSARDAGAAALLLPPPFFFPHTQQEIREFYLNFAENTGTPDDVFLRHPAGAGVNGFTPETAGTLLESAGFAGIADAGDSCLGLARTCTLITGDAWLVPARRGGACGAILETACAAPELAVALDRAIGAGRQAEVDRIETHYREFLEWSRRLPPLVAIKESLCLRGIKVQHGGSGRDLDCFREWFRDWMRQSGKLAAHG
jgi:4-hydroxy-tetrahydrodipicolinate synthase